MAFDIKSEYSIYESILTIDNILEFAFKLGLKSIAINFGSSTSGLLTFYRKAKKLNIKPIFVFQITRNDINLFLIPKNNASHSKIVRILSNFNNISDSDLNNVIKDSNIFKIIDSIDNNLLDILKYTENRDYLQILDSIYYSNKLIAEYNNDKSKKAIYIPKIRYLSKNDVELYRVIKALNKGIKFENSKIEDEISLKDFYLDKSISLEIYEKIQKQVDIDIEIENLEIEDSKRILKSIIDSKTLNKNLSDKEFNDIDKKNLSALFLVAENILETAKKLDILHGLGRGSVASSYISYLLGLSGFDPLDYNLIFERFLNRGIPDIDIDIEHNKRDYLVQELRNRFDVLEISNYSRITAKLSYIILDSVYKGENRDNLAKKLVGRLYKISKHPAGLIFCSNIREFITVNNFIADLDYKELDFFNIFKIDLLPLKNLTLLKRLIYSSKIMLSNIPLDDLNIFESLTRDSSQIFQLESENAKSIIRTIKPKSIEDLALVLALNRPGPIENDSINKYMNSDNYIYQEDLMLLLNKEGIKLEETYPIIKKIMKFSLNNLDNIKISNRVKNILNRCAKFSFNKAHAISYAYLTYYLAYFKKYHKKEFNLLYEEIFGNYRSLNKNIANPDINWSTKYSFYYEDIYNNNLNDCIVLGLEDVLGPKLTDKIISERDENGLFSSLEDLKTRILLEDRDLFKIKQVFCLIVKKQINLFEKSFNLKIMIDLDNLSDNAIKDLKLILKNIKGDDLDLILIKNAKKIDLDYKINLSSLKLLIQKFKNIVKLIPFIGKT